MKRFLLRTRQFILNKILDIRIFIDNNVNLNIITLVYISLISLFIKQRAISIPTMVVLLAFLCIPIIFKIIILIKNTYFNKSNTHFLSLIVRIRNEPYMEEFVNWYFYQGVTHIWILDDNLESLNLKYGTLSEKLKSDPRITIIPCDQSLKEKYSKPGSGSALVNYQEIEYQKLYKQIRNQSKWWIIVDADEFIIPKKELNISLKKSLETTFKDADSISVPWVMMAYRQDEYPESLLLTNIYRLDHDKRHPNPIENRKNRCYYKKISIKTIFKSASFSTVGTHRPRPTLKIIFYQAKEGVSNTLSYSNEYYNLRNKDIENGYLLCYHYRFYSKKHIIDKYSFGNDFYNESYDEKRIVNYPEIKDSSIADVYKKNIMQENLD
jgi:hypothetical protein